MLQPRIYGGAIFYDAADASTVLHAWREWVETVPEEMTSSVALLRLPDAEFVPEPLARQATIPCAHRLHRRSLQRREQLSSRCALLRRR